LKNHSWNSLFSAKLFGLASRYYACAVENTLSLLIVSAKGGFETLYIFFFLEYGKSLAAFSFN
jgi:hypothetical protein